MEKYEILNNITDLYIPREDIYSGWYYPDAIFFNDAPAIYDLIGEIKELCNDTEAKIKNENRYNKDFILKDYNIKIGSHYYRVHLQKYINGSLYILRKVTPSIPKLSTLGINENIAKILMHDKLNQGGLVLICGETGHGKTTTCGSVIKGRLEKYNGFCLTIEDPIELPLNGPHGKGVCVQTEVSGGQFASALRDAMRCYPTSTNSILYLGEVRDPETAIEVLRISNNGNLVFTTVHAPTVIEGIKRFLNLATANNPALENDIKSTFASSIRLVLHQRLKVVNQITKEKRLELDFLFSHGNSSIIANRIKDSKIDSLSTDLENQRNLLKNGKLDMIFDKWL